MHLDIIDMIIANVYNHPSHWYSTIHKYQDIDVVPTTCARICSLTSLARKRTAFYAYSERQHEPYAKMTALSPFYRSTAHPLHQSNPKASGPR